MCSKEVEVGKALYANLEAPSCALLKVRMDLQTVKFESKRIEPRRHEENQRHSHEDAKTRRKPFRGRA